MAEFDRTGYTNAAGVPGVPAATAAAAKQRGCYDLPDSDKPERQHLYAWMAEEEKYVEAKFDDQRNGHDESLRRQPDDNEFEAMGGFWGRQITQYIDRANLFLSAAASGLHSDKERRQLEMLGQQALAKGFMTFKGCVESSIRVYENLPKPGVSSGEVSPWSDYDAETDPVFE